MNFATFCAFLASRDFAFVDGSVCDETSDCAIENDGRDETNVHTSAIDDHDCANGLVDAPSDGGGDDHVSGYESDERDENDCAIGCATSSDCGGGDVRQNSLKRFLQIFYKSRSNSTDKWAQR